jgi:hypothetical protein
MKVITQLIKHFWERGALSVAEIEYLVRHGFVRVRDLPGYEPPPEEPPAPIEPLNIIGTVDAAHPLESVEESLVRRSARRGRGEPKGRIIDVKELCRRAAGELARREKALRAVVYLATGKASAANGPGDWRTAAQALRHSKPRLMEAFGRALRGGKITLRQTWQALDVEPFYKLLGDNEWRGRAAQAYAALLVADQSVGLGKYTWILRHDEMQAVSNLRVASAHVLLALERMYRSHVRLLTKALDRGADPALTWALLLLHNAHRSKLDPRDSKFVPDYGPVAPPSEEVWQQAWTLALGMDRPRLAKFLALCYKNPPSRDSRPPGVLACELYCPNGWHVPAKE